MRNSSPSRLLAALVALSASASAQLDPHSPPVTYAPGVRPPLPDLDVRYDEAWVVRPFVRDAVLAGREQALAARAANVARLQARVQGLRVDDHELYGTPQWVASTVRFLTAPAGSADEALAVVRGFVAANPALFEIGAGELAAGRVSRDFRTKHNGVRHLTFQQQVAGLDLFGCELKANVTRDGALLNVSSSMLPRPAGGFDVATVEVDARTALLVAASSIGADVTADFAPLGEPQGASQRQVWANDVDFRWEVPITTHLVLYARTRADVRPAWSLVLPEKGIGNTYEILVDATNGEVVRRTNRLAFLGGTQPITMRVYTTDSPAPMSPSLTTPSNAQAPFVPRVLVTINPVDVAAWSPDSWIDDGVNETQGNNVDAHLDLNADNSPDLPRPQGSPFRTFDFPQDNAQAPSTYRPAAVTQLFYLCNRYHDRLYELGWDEAAANYQDDNFGLGGVGGDRIQADCQDGSGTNNANFSFTTSDGDTGNRMQMYIFDGPTPDRDGDLDSDIVYHEFSHGLSQRIHGGLSGTQPQGMGEGWGDYFGVSLNAEATDDPNANYITGGYSVKDFFGLVENYYFGIRRFPYSTDFNKFPLTYADTDSAQFNFPPSVPISPIFAGSQPSEIHNVGEVWCNALLEGRAQLWGAYGFAGNQLMMQYVVDGMKLSPGNPTFLQARDGILQADLVATGGLNLGHLWTAFAKRGMGSSASSPGTSTSGIVEAYDVPTLVVFTYPNGLPTQLQPGVPTTFQVSIQGLAAVQPVAGTGQLHYSVDGGPFTAVAMSQTAANQYDATLPAAACLSEVRFYVGTATTAGTATDPANAPATTHTANAFTGTAVLASDAFEAPSGWTAGVAGDNATTGVWTRVDPVGTAAQPEDDHSAPGTQCFVTGQGLVGGGLGDNDVDGGRTTLLSPAIDLSASPAARVSYWRWYSNTTGGAPNADVFRVDVSNDNGGSWVNAETVGPGGPDTSGGWKFHQFRVSDFVAPTAQVRVRFVAEDAGTGSLIEAAVDDFQVDSLTCRGGSPFTPFCAGDGSLATACPCGNTGAAGRGCDNSSATGGSLLVASGSTNPDTVVLTASDELPTVLSIFLQGDASLPAGTAFGDGVRCVAGNLKRLYVKNASGGSVSAPSGGDPSITAQSAALGDPIAPGTTRHYQVYYRDPVLPFCDTPQGNSWNVSNGVSIAW